MAIMILVEEKSSVSLTDRLDEVVIKAGFELAFSEFSNLFYYFVKFSTAKVDLSYRCELLLLFFRSCIKTNIRMFL